MDEAVQPAPAGKPGTGTLPVGCAEDRRRVHYERRRPEDTALYRLVQEHLETFLAQVELETGAGLPEFVKEELDAFLDCGILARGFLRLRYADCAHETLVAFSCKHRGFCPSCGARRMAETAAHLVDHVIPRVPCANGCSRFRSRFACCSLHIRSCSQLQGILPFRLAAGAPELCPVAQAGIRYRHHAVPAVRRYLEDHRRHRRSARDRQDPHPSRVVRPGTAPIARTVIRPTPNGLIPAVNPLPSGSTP